MPNETPFFTDLSHFVAATHQDSEMILELLRRKRYEEAEEALTARSIKAQMVLKRLEMEPLPAVDLDLTEDATPAGRRYYVR